MHPRYHLMSGAQVGRLSTDKVASVKVNSLKSEKVDVTESITCSTLKSDTLILKSLKGNDLETLSLKTDSMESKIVNTGDLYSVAINADKIKTKELGHKDLQINAAKKDSLTSYRLGLVKIGIKRWRKLMTSAF